MLAAKDAMATIAVKDIAAAKKFYGGTWGLEAYPLTGVPLSAGGWPMADGIAGQRRSR